MIRHKRTCNPWTEEELTLLVRLHAEGLPNREIYPHIPTHTGSGVDTKMESLGLKRNRTPEKMNWCMPKAEKAKDVWPIKLRFENVTPTEAHQIRAGAPKSAPYRKQNIHHSIYGNPMAEMVA